MSRARRVTVWGAVAAGVLVLLASMAVCVAIGPVRVPVATVLEVIGRRARLYGGPVLVLDDQIVWELRLPRVAASAAAGAGLAVAGAVLQSLTRNALADPYILGISGGGTAGAVTVIVLGPPLAGLAGPAAMTAAAFAGAIAALLAVLALASSRSGALTTTRTVLAGVAVGQLCAAYTAFLVIVKGDSDAARRVLAWTLGSLAGARWESAATLTVAAAVALVAVTAAATWLDALAFGETTARSLGVPVTTVRWALMAGTSLLTAVIVAITGSIGFVGLVVPHVVRLVFGPLHRTLVPLSALGGAILLVWADTLARTVVTDQELPIGVVTAAVGAPVFAFLLRRAARRETT